jgi:Trypsin-like serine proteases, typically periplasmic, contain C-terminal PDZ domain
MPAEEIQSQKAPPDPNQPKQLRKQAKILLILGAINLFAVGFWCGSFVFPNKRVVTSVTDAILERAPGKPRLSGDTSIADAVARVDKSVVNIDSRFRFGNGKSGVAQPYAPMQKFFSPGRSGKPVPSNQPQHLQASGIFVSSDGYILTNNHVIAPGMEIRVTTYDNRDYRAVVAGRDPYSDLAVIKVDGANNFPVAPFADIKDIHPGDWAITIGSPGGFDHTVSIGVVSGVNRIVNNYDHHVSMIQTDAIMMPGSSGGPLINIDGKVMGISTVQTTVDNQFKGINFAIPANVAKDVANQLIEKGSIPRPYLGIVLQDYDPDRKKAQSLPSNPIAVLVGQVMPGGPADKMDIRPGDIIVKINGTPVKSAAEVRAFIKVAKPGDVFELTLRHFNAGDVFLRKITLGNYPVEM